MKRALAVLSIVAMSSTAVFSQTSPPSQQGAPAYGWGMGPGMMGPGYEGMGPGMMGAWGMGRGGMMGPGMMGPATTWRYPADLTQDQREKITQVQKEFWNKQYPLMQQMHALMWNGQAPNYDAMAGLQKQMIDNRTDMQKRIDAVLTPKQREELLRSGPY